MAILLPDARELSDDVLEANRLRACARGASWASPKSKSLASSVSPARPSVAAGPSRRRPRMRPLCHSCRLGGPLGSGRALSDAQAEHLQQLVRTHQPEELGIATPLWNRRAVRDLIRKEFDLDLAERTVRPVS